MVLCLVFLYAKWFWYAFRDLYEEDRNLYEEDRYLYEVERSLYEEDKKI